jgi:hypothetical protein
MQPTDRTARLVRLKNMATGPKGPGTNNDCAGEGQQQFTQKLNQDSQSWDGSQHSQSMVSHRHEAVISTVRCRYQAKTGKNIADWENMECASVTCSSTD